MDGSVGAARTVSPSAIRFACLKTSLLRDGLRVAGGSLEGKPPLRVRSGSCGGLDFVLPDGTYVNAPVAEAFAKTSPYQLRIQQGIEVVEDERNRSMTPVSLVASPAFYSQHTSVGTPLRSIGQLCFDRLGIGLTNHCIYWESKDKRCKFCSIGLNVKRGGQEQRYKSLEDTLEVVDAAYSDPVNPARHLLLGGGTPEGTDAGAIPIAQAATAIKARWPEKSIYAMVVPPEDLGYLEMLKESGVDELGMNVELFDDRAAARYIPGKHRQIGLDGYLGALERAVGLFGELNTRSITVAGLEDTEHTVRGVRELASRGVMPILSPFRPLVGTEMEHHPRKSAEELWELTLASAEAAGEYDVPLGPLCIPCQANTLNVPGHPLYRYY